MSYPQIVDYNAAVQDPRNTFTDPELRAGKVAETPLGLPLALSGGFALTYTVQSGGKKLAVRCFHKEVPQAQTRYAKISEKLRSLRSPYFVNFEFQSRGIRVLRAEYPIVKMDWAAGETLGVCLDRTIADSASIGALRREFATLSEYLERNGIAHGDIQNENVIVKNNAPCLIDYDGMFVSGLPEGQGSEVGHKHFQHPERSEKLFGPKMDRFSFIVLDASLEALQVDPTLYRRFREGGQAIIFKANDYADPSSSEVFRILNGHSALRPTATKLAAVCGAPISAVPTLADFKNGTNIPIAIVRPSTTAKAKPIPNYIGAYEVVDAKDFHAVLRKVGDKIELVGQIVSVKQGVGKRGRGRNLPYVFINFGPWNGESAKITIWSEGLGNMSARPSEAWVGKWISVTGLVEPPYDGKHYGRPYRNVGITVVSDNQIIQISAQDAKFRLGRGTSTRQQGPSKTRLSNEDILGEITRGTNFGSGTRPQSPPPKTKNEQILRGIKTASGQTQATPYRSAPSPVQHSAGVFSRIPKWVWVTGAILLLILLSRKR